MNKNNYIINKKASHTPVMIADIITYISTEYKNTETPFCIDATFGAGGYSKKMLEKGYHVIAFDQDNRVIPYAEEVASIYKEKFTFINDNFIKMPEYKDILVNKNIQAILFDVGVSSMQLDNPENGFSFQLDAPLDMRMNKNSEFSAKNVVNEYSQEELENIIGNYAQERKARLIAEKIVQARNHIEITSTLQLANIIKEVVRPSGHIHPATKTFQAIRIEVNNELENLTSGIESAMELISDFGFIAVVTFHSLEDKIVKEIFKNALKADSFTTMQKKAIQPSRDELKLNPRARSAKLRIIQKRRSK